MYRRYFLLPVKLKLLELAEQGKEEEARKIEELIREAV
jgi:hypothetical protein